MARLATVFLHTPGLGGVEERMAAGASEMPVLQDSREARVDAVAAAAHHGLWLDPGNACRWP